MEVLLHRLLSDNLLKYQDYGEYARKDEFL